MELTNLVEAKFQHACSSLGLMQGQAGVLEEQSRLADKHKILETWTWPDQVRIHWGVPLPRNSRTLGGLLLRGSKVVMHLLIALVHSLICCKGSLGLMELEKEVEL